MRIFGPFAALFFLLIKTKNCKILDLGIMAHSWGGEALWAILGSHPMSTSGLQIAPS